jgi:hypothetical protein
MHGLQKAKALLTLKGGTISLELDRAQSSQVERTYPAYLEDYMLSYLLFAVNYHHFIDG